MVVSPTNDPATPHLEPSSTTRVTRCAGCSARNDESRPSVTEDVVAHQASHASHKEVTLLPRKPTPSLLDARVREGIQPLV